MTWQPIDTAPKDGTNVWLFCPDEEPQQCAGYFTGEAGAYWEPCDTLVSSVILEVLPTHWMPLPDAPKVEE